MTRENRIFPSSYTDSLNLLNQSWLNNFTFSKVWQLSGQLRFGQENFIKKEEYSFYRVSNNKVICLNYFDFKNKSVLTDACSTLFINSKVIEFKYMNKSSLDLNILIHNLQHRFGKNYCTQIVEEWDSPLLILNNKDFPNFESYINTFSQRLKRTIRKIKEYKIYKPLHYSYSSSNDKITNLQLWLNALQIDVNSWKKWESSNMDVLQREDLQYIFPLILEPEYFSLAVSMVDTYPVAFSLMGKSRHMWFSIKWGCHQKYRPYFLGIDLMLNHLQYLHNLSLQEKDLYYIVDFWGKNNEVYSQIANAHIERCHINIVDTIS